jgi:hypothetical protein
MRKKFPLTALLIGFVFFFNPTRGFTQQQSLTMAELSEELSDLATDMAGTVPFMASIGLDWEDTYIGQLTDFPPHWGFGLTIGATTSKIDNINTLLSKFGYESDDGFVSKQLLPAYVAEVRLGGFNMAPFDIGLKFGLLPYVPIFTNSINYEACVYGLDFRWRIVEENLNFPAISIGVEIDHANGGLRRSMNSLITTPMGDMVINGGTAGVVWDAWVFNLKLIAAKNFWDPRITVFGGMLLGAAITKTGYQFTDGDSIYINGNRLSNMSESQLGDIQSALQGAAGKNTTFVVNDNSITGWIDVAGFNFNVHQGIAFRFEYVSLSVSLMWDVVHFEMGANISLKYLPLQLQQ